MQQTFEAGFASVERDAQAAAKAAAALKAAATALHNAAVHGDIAKLRRQIDRLSQAMQQASDATDAACKAWPFRPEQEVEYLRNGYARELVEAATAAGVAMVSRDQDLVAFPCVLRIDPAARSLRIDRTRYPGLRPSHVARTIAARRNKRARVDAARFLDVLRAAYGKLVAPDDFGATLPLARIYETLTMLPWVAADYDRQEFARDLLVLNASGVNRTRDGSQVAFPASTALKSAVRDVFSIVDESGETITFYGVRFTRPAS